MGEYITYILAAVIIGYIIFRFIKVNRDMNKPQSENLKVLSDDNFKEVTGKGVSLVDFHADWCGPCKVQGPIVNELADEINDKANICKLDIDKNQKTAQMLGIQSIPTLIVFLDGKPVQKLVGVKPKRQLLKTLEAYI
jgi:thioredoxin 1